MSAHIFSLELKKKKLKITNLVKKKVDESTKLYELYKMAIFSLQKITIFNCLTKI